MTATAPKLARGVPWAPSLPKTNYRRASRLTKKERDAIITHIEHRDPRTRRRNRGLFELPEDHPLAPLLRPVVEALRLMGTKQHDRNSVLDVLLRGCLNAGLTFWAWDHERWIDLLGTCSREFRPREGVVISQSVRIERAAVAYVHGWFRDVLALGRFRRESLARRVFGVDGTLPAFDLLFHSRRNPPACQRRTVSGTSRVASRQRCSLLAKSTNRPLSRGRNPEPLDLTRSHDQLLPKQQVLRQELLP